MVWQNMRNQEHLSVTMVWCKEIGLRVSSVCSSIISWPKKVQQQSLSGRRRVIACWDSVRMTKKRIVVFAVLLLVVLTAWAPWLTDDFAISRVVEKLGGQGHPYNYLGEVMPLGDVPKSVIRVPFGALVYFPSEAVYFVTLFGLVL